jgi:hypothetical protein
MARCENLALCGAAESSHDRVEGGWAGKDAGRLRADCGTPCGTPHPDPLPVRGERVPTRVVQGDGASGVTG